MAQMDKIKFLSEVEVDRAPVTSGYIRNIWLGTTNMPENIQVGAKFESAGYVGNVDYILNDKIVIHDKDSSIFQTYKCALPENISQVAVTSDWFYNTTGNQQATSLIIPVKGVDEIACSAEDLICDPINTVNASGNTAYSGTIHVSWPRSRQVEYLLINTNGATKPPVVSYSQHKNGDIYVQYEE